jgi:hypothetical protein
LPFKCDLQRYSTEAGAAAFFGANNTRVVAVTLRDAGAPEVFAAPALGTAGNMYAAMFLFLAGILAGRCTSVLFLYKKFLRNQM